MKIAIQEDMLSGKTLLQKFHHAKELGVDGIEFWGKGLTPKVPDIVGAIAKTGIVAASVNHGRQSRFLDPDPAERERALAELRASMCDAVDIGAKGVIFVPHFFGPLLPDLMPFKTPVQLEAGLLVALIKTFMADFSHAMGVELYVEPVNRYETHFLNRLEQAAEIRRKAGSPEHVKIVADLFHMALDEADIAQAIRDNAEHIGHVHLADSNRRLPGQGTTDFAAAASALNAIGYDGWAAYECGDPGDNAPRARQYRAQLPESVAHVRAAGFA